MRRPNFFIVGAPKAGTTSLYAYLQPHPDVYMSPVKEPQYFSIDVEAHLRRPFTYPDVTGYLSLFSGAGDEKAVGEASTSYLVSHEAPTLIREFSPDAQIVVMLRNPIDQIQAFHNERVSNGAEPLTDLEDALNADERRRQGKDLPPGFNPLGAVYVDNARFGEQLRRWLAVFEADGVHWIVFDDFASHTEAEYAKVLRFLQVDDTYRPDSFIAHNARNRRRGGIVRRLLGSGGAQWVRHEVAPAVIGEVRAYRLARAFSRSRLNRTPSERAEMPAAVRDGLKAALTDDVRLLGELIGRDLVQEWFKS